jgi:hypothetical protein
MSSNSDANAACGSDLISFDSPAVKGMLFHILIPPDFILRFPSLVTRKRKASVKKTLMDQSF